MIQTPLASPTADASPTAVLTPVPGARLAIPYDSIINYLAEVPDQETERVVCIYDKEMGVVDCEDAGLGLIQLDPPPPAEIEVECSAILLHDELIAVNCKGIDAILAVVYRVE